LFLLLLLALAIAGSLVVPHDPYDVQTSVRLQGPSSSHWLGTDDLGRDTLSRLIIGARTSLTAVAIAVGIALVVGVSLGLLAGSSTRWLDAPLSRFMDGLLSLPPLVLALAIIGALGPGLGNAMVAVGVVSSPRFFRLARAASAAARQELYVEALTAVGCSRTRILLLHVAPNASGPLLVEASVAAGAAVMAEAGLSFLGLGARPPTPSWGGMVQSGFASIYDATFTMIPAAVAIVVTVLAFMFVADGLRDTLSGPRRRG